MTLPLALAWRFVRSRPVHLVAVAALALCLTVQIVVMAVLDGMLVDMERRVRDLGEQVTLSFLRSDILTRRPEEDLPGRADLLRTEAELRLALPGLRGVTPLVRGSGVLERRGAAAPVIVYGIDLARELEYSRLADHLLDWRPDPRRPEWQPAGAADGPPPLLLGCDVAEQTGTAAGDEVTLAFAAGGSDRVERRVFRVASIYRSGSPIRDWAGAYIPLEVAQAMFLGDGSGAAPDRIPVFALWLENPDEAEAIEAGAAATVRRILGRDEVWPANWQRAWRGMAEGMRYENNLQEIVLALMNLSGGFCVFAILATLVSRRARDVGLLRCLGMGRTGVTGVFLLVGLLLGLAGAALGLLGGWLLAEPGAVLASGRPLIDWLFERLTGTPLYPPRMFLVGGVQPVFGWKAGLYAGAAVLIALGAACWPALWAGRREPIEALRDDG